MTKKTFIGKVVSNKMQKTIVVETERKFAHPLYKKILKRTGRLKADVSGFEPRVGQLVRIKQSKPVSRDKHFRVVEVIKEEAK